MSCEGQRALRGDHRYGVRECPSCGRLVDLDRNGRYCRHFAFEPDGDRHLCVASGRLGEGIVQILAVEPTPEEPYSHALKLLRSS